MTCFFYNLTDKFNFEGVVLGVKIFDFGIGLKCLFPKEKKKNKKN